MCSKEIIDAVCRFFAVDIAAIYGFHPTHNQLERAGTRIKLKVPSASWRFNELRRPNDTNSRARADPDERQAPKKKRKRTEYSTCHAKVVSPPACLLSMEVIDGLLLSDVWEAQEDPADRTAYRCGSCAMPTRRCASELVSLHFPIYLYLPICLHISTID